jgi:hypothetical protein
VPTISFAALQTSIDRLPRAAADGSAADQVASSVTSRATGGRSAGLGPADRALRRLQHRVGHANEPARALVVLSLPMHQVEFEHTCGPLHGAVAIADRERKMKMTGSSH